MFDYSSSWKVLNPIGEESDVEDEDSLLDIRLSTGNVAIDLPPIESVFFDGVINEASGPFKKMQQLLCENLYWCYNAGELCWPKKRSEILNIFNEKPRALFPNSVELQED